MATSDMLPARSRNFELRGYDYWALGHIHARQVLCKEPMVVFAGNVQGRHIRETGPKGCLLVTIHPDQRIEAVFHRLDQVRWERGSVDIAELETESEFLGRAAEMFDGLLASEPDPDSMLAVRVTLCGRTVIACRAANRCRSDSWPRSAAWQPNGAAIGSGSRRSSYRPSRQRPRHCPMAHSTSCWKSSNNSASTPTAMNSVIDDLAELKRKLPAELISRPRQPATRRRLMVANAPGTGSATRSWTCMMKSESVDAK